MNSTNTVSKLLLTKSEAAKQLSLSTRSVEYLIQDGRLPSVRIGARILIRTTDLHAFVTESHPDRIRPA